jgi:hypothetical protein
MNTKELREKVREILVRRCPGEVNAAVEEIALLVQGTTDESKTNEVVVRCEWGECQAVATAYPIDTKGILWDVCPEHEREGEELERWRPEPDEGSAKG